MQFIDLNRQYDLIKDKLEILFNNVLEEKKFIMGPYVRELEEILSSYVGVKHAIACANGTDALVIALKALGIKEGDSVFVPSFTFFATAEAVSIVGAKPIFVDVDEKTFNIDPDSLIEKINENKHSNLRARAIITVDLFGLPANYEKISEIAKKHGLYIIEDGAQGFGGEINGRKACSFGDISTTSFFPAKPLGCYGDGGCIFTDSDELNSIIRSLIVHGKGKDKYDNIRIGTNSRLDTLQAAVLLCKMDLFDDEMKKRKEVADRYTELLKDHFDTPVIEEGYVSSYAQYTLRTSTDLRDKIVDYAKSKGVPINIYYVTPIHMSEAYRDENELKVSERIKDEVFSIPMHPYLRDEEIEKVVNVLIEARRK
ncbi:MAG: aminotransferase DegT [Clostridiales bacterium]|nr:MAG: aminotransferase DegT [Clostridiales bacterium]